MVRKQWNHIPRSVWLLSSNYVRSVLFGPILKSPAFSSNSYATGEPAKFPKWERSERLIKKLFFPTFFCIFLEPSVIITTFVVTFKHCLHSPSSIFHNSEAKNRISFLFDPYMFKAVDAEKNSRRFPMTAVYLERKEMPSTKPPVIGFRTQWFHFSSLAWKSSSNLPNDFANFQISSGLGRGKSHFIFLETWNKGLP